MKPVSQFTTQPGLQLEAGLYPVVGKDPNGTPVLVSVDADGNLNTADGGITKTMSRGVSGVPFTSADASGGVAAVTDAPTTGQKLVMTDLIVSVGSDLTVTFTEETSGTLVAKVYMAANTTVNLVTRGKRKLAVADKKLNVQTSAGGGIAVEALYYSEA